MKQIAILLLVCLLVCSCSSNNADKGRATLRTDSVPISHLDKGDTAEKQHIRLPFIGKRMFVTRPGISGTGTPQYYIEILENGDVFFSFGQHDMSDDREIAGRYYAGKFNPYLKSVFVQLDNEIRYYYVAKDTIYEVDVNHQRLSSDECCGVNQLERKCFCESEYYPVPSDVP